MTFDLPSLLAGHATDGAELQARYLNPQLPRTLRDDRLRQELRAR